MNLAHDSADRSLFFDDYFQAKQAFQTSTRSMGFECSSFSILDQHPELTVDVATQHRSDAGTTLLITSGLHGVEGFFGTAALLKSLDNLGKRSGSQPGRIVLVHALNPFGYAHIRRMDEANIDPNRNFFAQLPPTTSPHYARLDSFLNPTRQPPSKWSLYWGFVWNTLRYGFSSTKQAIAEGQSDFPAGLFFTGTTASKTRQLVESQWKDWIGEDRQVLHVDFHTGLGRRGQYQFLMVQSLAEAQTNRLLRAFPNTHIAWHGQESDAYETVSDFGNFGDRNTPGNYVYACAEFGTYGPLLVLQALREENYAHHHYCQESSDPRFQRAKQTLKETFCPSDENWRTQVLNGVNEIVSGAVNYFQ